MILRTIFRYFFPEPPPADRLAIAFHIEPREAQKALDAVGGGEPHASLLLLYAAMWNRGVDGALEDFGARLGPVRLRECLTIWAGTLEGQRALLSWRLAQALPERWWLDRIDARLRKALRRLL